MKRSPGRWLLAFIFVALTAVSGLANSDVVRMRLNTAMRYITMGWFHEAVRHAEEAVKVSPQHGEARMWLALLQHADGQHEAALWQYDLAISLAPDAIPLAVFMGDIRRAQHRLDEAAELYRLALAEDENLGLGHYGLGRVLEQQGDPAAREAYERGVQLAPDLVDLRFRLGRWLRDNGQFESALEHLLHANAINPDLAHVRFELGLTYEGLGRLSAAEHEYRTALRLDPSHEQAKSRLAAMSSM